MNKTEKKEREKRVDDIIERGVIVNILPEKEAFRERLLSSDPMKIYIGADPTSTALHLSHAKNYILLEEIRQLGHQVFVLFGDFTAKIGDPTDKIVARDQLTTDQVRENVDQWLEQIKPLMNFGAEKNPPEIVFNSEWLSKLKFTDVINLASNFTVQQMIARDMFTRRVEEEKPIYLHEFLYPLMQGYDSVVLDVDAELCGTDQTFNALIGRDLLKKQGKEKFVVAVNLMEDPKTGNLMSKSQGTGVFLNADAFDMYGAIMSQPDEMTEIILVNNTRVSLDEIEDIISGHPFEAKKRAASEVTKIFHGEEASKLAEKDFISTFSKNESSSNAEEISAQKGAQLADLLNDVDVVPSKSQFRRLVEQGAITNLDTGKKITNPALEVTKTTNFKIGKHRFVKVVI
jgi:tyrosyl-tRNA synthetase